jgi:subtilisin
MRRPFALIAATALLLSLGAGTSAAGPTRSGELDANPAGRWIVVLKPGSDAAALAASQGRRVGFSADRTFRHAIRGYAARLSSAQVGSLRRDPTVAAVVPDERIQIEGQITPTGISRIGDLVNPIAAIDGNDTRVDADVAIVDTGIAPLADLNVVGGYSCANSSSAAWADGNGHGTHVAGTVGAIDNGSGVVGVAPGVRLWAVKILDASGAGLLSWYICGLDWIAAQKDPSDPTKPLFEAANMSVAKWGHDDVNCGFTNHDPLHQAICRLVASGVTVVAAAANDSASASARVPASYNEVITVSALADTDGKPGGLGGNRCYSWGTYDKDDTFADFSNYGSDVDLIAPGKCIWSTVPGGYQYMSGTSMAAPHVTGAVALLKQDRPYLTPAEVREALQYLGTTNWKTWTDPDPYHEHLLDVSRIGPRGDFSLTDAPGYISPNGGTARVPITVRRDATSFERVRLTVSGLPDGATAWFSPASVYGFADATSILSIHLPGPVSRTFAVTVRGDEHGNAHTTTANVGFDSDLPTAVAPSSGLRSHATLGVSSAPVTVRWAAGSDPTSGISGYELQRRVDGGAWTDLAATDGTTRSANANEAFNHAYEYRVRAEDGAGNWSGWARAASRSSKVVQETSASIAWTGTWTHSAYRYASGGAIRWTTSSGARARFTFSGRSVALVAPIGPTRGTASVYVDGVYRQSISFRSSRGASRQTMYVTAWSAIGTHTIEIRVSGSRRVDIDAFVVRR